MSAYRGHGLSRRQFVQGLAAGVAATGLPYALPAATPAVLPAVSRGLPELSGSEFDLHIGSSTVNITGTPRVATLINGLLPGPLLRWREGDTVTLRVTNHLSAPTSLHWHGVLVPNAMDGVPGAAFAGIAPGETFAYRFPVRQSGTYWYHSHSGFQQQTGLYAPLLIEPRDADPVQADRDYVVMLSDWTDEDPQAVYRHLKTGDGYYNYRRRTLGDFFRDVSRQGLAAALQDRWAWGAMRMDPRDIADVSGALLGGTYTYLINGQPPAANWTGLFKPGERVRLRFINGSSMSYFDVRIPGLKMSVVAADGCNIEPVSVDEMRIAAGETYDVIVEPSLEAYTIFAQAMDRSGYARATLAVREGLTAAVPPLDPIYNRTMADMGMATMPMKGMSMPGASASHEMPGMNGMDMPGMDMSHMDMSQMKMPGMDMPGMQMPGAAGQEAAMPMPAMKSSQTAYPRPEDVHLQSGPAITGIAMNPIERLGEAGDGLDGNGRRVLTYADLARRADGPQNEAASEREPDAEVLLHLTGNMDRYLFGFNGMTNEQGQPVRFPLGQRIRVTLINDTMMEHPIHLHGMFTTLDNHRGLQNPLKHTVNVKPGEKLHYTVNATEPGHWAYHCHLLYHMEGGMFTTAVVA